MVGERGVLLALSDGMGGAQAGEVASALVLESVQRTLERGGIPGAIHEQLEDAVKRANQHVLEAANTDNRRGMGATVLGAGYLLIVIYLLASMFKPRNAPANPWGATGLEWSIPSPPITLNFETDPVVTENAYDYVSRGKQQSREV